MRVRIVIINRKKGTILKTIRKILGIICLFQVFVGISLLFTDLKDYPILGILICSMFGLFAYLLLRKRTKKSALEDHIILEAPQGTQAFNEIKESNTIIESDKTNYCTVNNSTSKRLEAAQTALNNSLNQLNNELSSENIFKVTVSQNADILTLPPQKTKDFCNNDGNKILKTDGRKISDEEIPYLIQAGYEEIMRQNAIKHNYPEYMGMRIVSNTIPAKENYEILNNNEKLFFQAFYNQLTDAKLSPSLIKFTRLSNGEFNVDYIDLCYIGKINLYQPPVVYAVIKEGNKRATKKFSTLQDAENYISQNKNYRIEMRQPFHSNSMQYSRGSSTIKNLHDLSIDQCIELIPYWIRYIKYCKQNDPFKV